MREQFVVFAWVDQANKCHRHLARPGAALDDQTGRSQSHFEQGSHVRIGGSRPDAMLCRGPRHMTDQPGAWWVILEGFYRRLGHRSEIDEPVFQTKRALAGVVQTLQFDHWYGCF